MKLASEELRERIETRIGRAPRKLPVNALQSKTVVLAFKYRDGLIMAADRRTVAGDYVYSDATKKITRISPFSALGNSGTVAAIDLINEIYKSELNGLRVRTHDEVSIANQVRLLSNIVAVVSSILPDDFYSTFLLGGYDCRKRTPAIVSVDWYLGAKFPHKTFGAIGSGEEKARNILKDYFDLEQRTVQETDETRALHLALKALKAAAEEIHVSPPELSPPTIVIITEKEYRNLPEEKVENLIDILGIRRRRR